MVAGDGDRRVVGFYRGALEAEPRHRLGDQTAAATDVAQGQARERRQGTGIAAEMRVEFPPDEAEPCRVQPVQRLEAAARIPPARRLRGKAGDFRRVDGWVDRIVDCLHAVFFTS